MAEMVVIRFTEGNAFVIDCKLLFVGDLGVEFVGPLVLLFTRGFS